MVYAPGTLETDQKKQNMALQQQASAITTATTNIATNTANIATNTAAITVLQTPGTGLTGGGGSSLAVSLSKITASLGADVALNNSANYFDGPSVAQGTSGTWFASGTVTLTGSAASEIWAKLWDGTTVIASASVPIYTGSGRISVTLSGYIASPAGNIRISCRDSFTTTSTIEFNRTGNSKDSTITAVRIA
jgi:hypothetical protein